jgi:hypothetical protein
MVGVDRKRTKLNSFPKKLEQTTLTINYYNIMHQSVGWNGVGCDCFWNEYLMDEKTYHVAKNKKQQGSG